MFIHKLVSISLTLLGDMIHSQLTPVNERALDVLAGRFYRLQTVL